MFLICMFHCYNENCQGYVPLSIIYLKGGVFMYEKISINELALKTVEALQEFGLATNSAWNEYCVAYLPVVKLHEKRGKEYFDRGIAAEYSRFVEGRRERGEISVGYYRFIKHGIARLTEFHDTGKLEWSCPKKVSKYKLNDYFEAVIFEFLSHNDFHHNTRGDIVWVSRKYFSWLIHQGCHDLHAVGVDEIQQFMIYCSRYMKSSSVHNVKLYMKKLYRFLAESGYASDSYEGLFSFRVSRECRMFPAIPQDEIAAMLEMIDRLLTKGKRDYAIILLGIVTGLRAVDITKLRLIDIDWRKGEIRIVQSKTGKSLTLPLTKDVGEAIQDYILHGRQKTKSDAVFLRMRAPFQAFASGVAIENVYDYYRRKAGLPRDAFDGKGFHALRRSIGRNMVVSGTPITTVAQVLGDRNMNSAKKYISLDSEHLKECALDFSGIESGIEVAQ